MSGLLCPLVIPPLTGWAIRLIYSPDHSEIVSGFPDEQTARAAKDQQHARHRADLNQPDARLAHRDNVHDEWKDMA